ncbi:amino acid adenylation domain-containing protein, partial [Aquabacterium sp. A7-Y]|uniref:non-ribosomal peptide synthetase n=1 Tax=Aquabacterium sp. A7-Y TaxID=1349605 RepID=UPI00223CD4CC
MKHSFADSQSSTSLQVGSKGGHPLSSVQQVVWIDQMLSGDTPNYNIGVVVRIDGALDLGMLEAAIAHVVNRSDAMRMVLTDGADGVKQEVLREVPTSLNVQDWRDHPDGEEGALRHLRECFKQPFDVHAGLLWEFRLIRTGISRHYWLLRCHHLITDGFGVSLIVGAVADAYNAIRQAGTADSALPAYLDFVADDRAYLSSARFQRDRDFWRHRYAQLPEPLLPQPHGTEKQIVPAGQAIWRIKRHTMANIEALAAAHQCSLQHFMLALFYAYFSRVTDRDEIVIGVPVHNRSSARDKATLGMFSSMVPIGVTVDRQAGFAELLHAVAGELRRCYRHQRFPLAELNRSVQLAQFGRQQLFDLTLSYEQFAGDYRFGDATIHGLAMHHGTARLPLEIFVRDYHRAEDVVVELNYKTTLLDAEAVAGMQRRLSRLLDAVLQDPHCTLLRLPLLDAAERQQVVVDFNATRTAYPAEASVHRLFERQAAQRPDAVALVHEAGVLSYGELNARANRLAHLLRRQGLLPGQAVALVLPRSVELLVAELAVLKCGSVYVPIDPDFPLERQAFMVRDSRAVLVIGPRPPAALHEQVEALWLVLDELAGPLERSPTANLPLDGDGTSPAYIMYTSGSTGTPKGVVAPHRGISRIAVANGYAEIGPDDCIGHCSNPAFDACTFETWGALLNGARVVIVPQATVLDPHQLAALLLEQGATLLFLTVGLFNQHARELGPLFRQLNYLLTGGDVLDRDTIAWVLRHSPPRHLLNVYGPTETTTFATRHYITELPNARIPIGRPIANTQVYILDAAQQPVPIGVAGELYIGGDGVATGYFGRDELTAERFIPDPFSSTPGARLYKTGDLGCWRPDGSIDFLGRNDQQVKIRGFRIEPGEIEAQLTRLAEVREAVVLVREDQPGDKRLVAYVTQQGEAEPDLDALRAQLRSVLPDYMVPAAFVSLPALPLNPNGKLDRRALPMPDLGALAARRYEAAQGDAEVLLATLWQELLQVERVGRHDHFFDLGGHSLTAVGLVERLRRLGWACEGGSVFEHPVLSQLAARLGRPEPARAAPAALIPPGARLITPEMLTLVRLEAAEIERIVARIPGGAPNVQDIYPLAPLQEGLYFHHLLSNQADTYIIPSLWEFAAPDRLDAFLSAVQAVIDRHDILRTAVLSEGLSRPVQVVCRRAVLPVQALALQEGSDPVAQLRAHLAPERLQMDLQQAPLLRAQVAREPGGSRCWALLQLHHIVGDHVSLEIILAEVKAHLEGRAAQLPPPVSYRDFVAYTLAHADQAEAEAFFREQLADVHEPTLPFGLLDVHGDGQSIEEATLELPASLAQQLRAVARAHGVSPATVCHLAWAALLALASGRDDVVFGSVLSGRLQGLPGADRALGMFINTLPLRLRLQGADVRLA